MKRLFIAATVLAAVGLTVIPVSAQQKKGKTVTLFGGKNLDNFHPIGDANWSVAGGVVQADKGNGYLVTKESYKDFEFTAEFWTDEKANSGVFIRCSDPAKIDAVNAYEVNIFDTRPDPKFATGSIVNVSPSSQVIKAGGKWNTYKITAQGDHFVVVLNGITTVDAHDNKHADGAIGLQYAAGVVKFKNVKIKRL